jgi:hypothetical protein
MIRGIDWKERGYELSSEVGKRSTSSGVVLVVEYSLLDFPMGVEGLGDDDSEDILKNL